MCVDQLGSEGVQVRTHLGNGDEQGVVGGFLDRPFGDAEFCARNNCEFACRRVQDLRQGKQG